MILFSLNTNKNRDAAVPLIAILCRVGMEGAAALVKAYEGKLT